MKRLVPYFAVVAMAAALAGCNVKTDGGVVVLTGTARSQDQVAIATDIAQRQEGVSRVDNRVGVK